MHFRRNGLSRTAAPVRHASAPRSYTYPAPRQISRSPSCVLRQPGSQGLPLQSSCRLPTSSSCALPLPRMWRGSCVPPATGTLWNVRTVSSSSPNGERSTTDSILSAGHGRTARSCSTHRRTESRMWGGYRSAPGAAPFRRASPMPPREQTPRYGLFLSGADSPGSIPEDIHFPPLSL